MVREAADIAVLGLVIDAYTVNHIADHFLTPDDVLAVLEGEPQFFVNLPNRGGTHVMIGYDDKGRVLYISMTETDDKGEWQVVTGWESRIARRLLRPD